MANNLVPGPAPIAQEVQHSVVEALQQMFKEMNARFTALESKIDAVNANCNASHINQPTCPFQPLVNVEDATPIPTFAQTPNDINGMSDVDTQTVLEALGVRGPVNDNNREEKKLRLRFHIGLPRDP